MAISSFPFDGQDTDETQFSLLFRELQDSGVADSHGGTGFKVSSGTGMAVQVQPGLALVRGFAINSTAIETRTIPPAATGTVIHRVVLRLDPATNAIGIDVISGSVGGSAPALTQTTSGIFEIPLALVTVPSGTSNMSNSLITDDRDYIGTRVGAWSTDKRPATARKGRVGYNSTLGIWEGWTGTAWAPLAPSAHRIGDIKMSLNAAVEAGWLKMDGTTYNVADYPALVAAAPAAITVTGSTFTIADLRSSFPTQAGGTVLLGGIGGSNTKTLAVANIPTHAHSINHDHGSTANDGGHEHGYNWSEQDGTSRGTMRVGTFNDGRTDTGAIKNTGSAHSHDVPAYSGNSGNAGSGTAFDVRNAYLAVNFLIRAV